MAGESSQRLRVGAVVVVLGLLALGGVAVWSGSGPDAASDRAAGQPKGEPDPAAPPVTTNGSPGSKRDPVAGADGADPANPGSEDAAGAGDGGGPGPVGEVTATSVVTTAAPPPEGGFNLVSPRFSPKGSRVLALVSKAPNSSVWIAKVDDIEGGWTKVNVGVPVTEADWLNEDTLVYVHDSGVFSYRIGGTSFAILDPADEPGRTSQPAASPDGNQVAYVSTTTTNGGGDIRVVDRTSSVVRSLTASRETVVEPAWRADGQAVAGVVDGTVTAWLLDSSRPLARFQRPVAARNPGWWGEALVWQEGSGFAVNVMLGHPQADARLLVRGALASAARPIPVAGGYAWVSALSDRGTLWAVRPDGSGVVVDTDTTFASQPDVVLREDGLWLAFTSAHEKGQTRIHVGKLDPESLSPGR